MDGHDRLTDLFLRAIEMPSSEREAFLDEACKDDPALRQELDSLLLHREKASQVLGENAIDVEAHLDALSDEAIAPDETSHPERIGTYRILRILGRGGMGIVYEAEQERPRRTVALKVIPPGWLAPSGRRRFDQEARILALLQHPGIAQVFEAGEVSTDYGLQPFFAMELIRGNTLLRFAVEKKLAVEERLKIFAKICDAVHYAHQKGVVHRDLKPANILVDEMGQPKVLDFGIARITESDLRMTTLHTESNQFLGTLSYMSPEQLSQSSSTINSASDVYSLGVVLYELLIEKLPYDLNDLPFPEAVRIIQETEPDFSSIDHRCALSRDIRTILVKALEKTIPRRYATADELGADVRRFLAFEPIRARPASTAYQLMKFARRNKPVALGLAATLLALLLGLLGTGWQAFQATRQRNQVLRLSDMKRLENLEDEATSLWPANPNMLYRLATWLTRARVLGERLALHEKALAALREGFTPGNDGTWALADTETQWQHDTLCDLVKGLRILVDPDPLVGTLRNVEERVRHAKTVQKETIDNYREIWDLAVAAIADPVRCPQYKGLKIIPQLGLVPLGQDSSSGLWEFAHLQTGVVPEPGPEGARALSEGSSLVLVLVPGGTFLMGAHPKKGPNRDPFAQGRDRPVHEITLDPFFLSKYEMTQGQWERIAHENKSYYGPDNYQTEWSLEKITYSNLLPLDDVSWDDCHRVLNQVGLVLPTEAQWEYAARAGTQTIWWTGDEPSTLQGAANLADRFCKEEGGPAGWQYELSLFDGYSVNARVGSFRANRFGLHDVHGNVWEWCLDCYDLYRFPVREGDGLRLMEKIDETRVFRGGSHANVASDVRSAKRDYYKSDSSNFDLGVRPARGLERELPQRRTPSHKPG